MNTMNSTNKLGKLAMASGLRHGDGGELYLISDRGERFSFTAEGEECLRALEELIYCAKGISNSIEISLGKSANEVKYKDL